MYSKLQYRVQDTRPPARVNLYLSASHVLYQSAARPLAGLFCHFRGSEPSGSDVTGRFPSLLRSAQSITQDFALERLGTVQCTVTRVVDKATYSTTLTFLYVEERACPGLPVWRVGVESIMALAPVRCPVWQSATAIIVTISVSVQRMRKIEMKRTDRRMTVGPGQVRSGQVRPSPRAALGYSPSRGKWVDGSGPVIYPHFVTGPGRTWITGPCCWGAGAYYVSRI